MFAELEVSRLDGRISALMIAVILVFVVVVVAPVCPEALFIFALTDVPLSMVVVAR